MYRGLRIGLPTPGNDGRGCRVTVALLAHDHDCADLVCSSGSGQIEYRTFSRASRQGAVCSSTMTDGVTVLFGAVGAVVAILDVLVPVIRAQGATLCRETEGQGTSLRRVNVDEARGDLHVLRDRVARIEGTLTDPWSPPANGTPSPASSPQSKTEQQYARKR